MTHCEKNEKSERLTNKLIFLKNKQFFNLKDLMEEFNISMFSYPFDARPKW